MDSDDSGKGVVLKIPRKWFSSTLFSGMTFLSVVGFGGVWQWKQTEQDETAKSLISTVRQNTEQLRNLEGALQDELDRRRAAEVAAAAVQAKADAAVALLNARITVLETCHKSPRSCPHK